MCGGELMNVKALAENSGLNVKAVRFLEKMGLIADPLSEENLYFMQWLAVIWKKEEFIRLQVANLSMSRRVRVLFGAGYTKTECYMIHRMLAHYSDKEDGDSAPLHLSQLVDEVIGYYNLPKTTRHELTAKAYQLRKRICNMRYKNPNLVEIAKTLTTTRKPKPKLTGPKGGSPQQQQFCQNDIFGH